MRSLLIAEAVPLKEGKMEVLVLGEFIRLFRENFRDDYFFECKSDFLDYLDRYVVDPKYNKRHGKYKYIHLSGHARYYKKRGAVFSFPKGNLSFDELPKNCFKGMVVTFSACDLGQKTAMEQFIERTKAKCVIAPQNSPRFEDAALWFINYYYLLLKQRLPIYDAFNTVNSMISSKADFRVFPEPLTK
jgi:hypothetical protein